MVKLGVGSTAGRQVVFIEAGIHAREWISTASAVYLIYTLLQPTSLPFLERFTWYIVPTVNPDGYEFSHTSDRMWRKSRAKMNDSDCFGVDLNRNWPNHWGVGGSRDPCSEVFQGPYPFSEPESQALMKAILKV